MLVKLVCFVLGKCHSALILWLMWLVDCLLLLLKNFDLMLVLDLCPVVANLASNPYSLSCVMTATCMQ